MSDDQKTALEIAREKAEAEAKATNESRGENKGTRISVGATRGKNPQVITFEEFDFSLPKTLPESVKEFAELLQETNEKVMLDYLLRGYNAAAYEAASDPLAEFVVDSWDKDTKNTFRLAVRNYSRGLEISLEDAVAIIRPGFVKKFGA